MHYWRLRVNPSKNTDYYVFYKTPVKLSRSNVLQEAVMDGDLLDVFARYVDQINEIPAEVYYENMND